MPISMLIPLTQHKVVVLDMDDYLKLKSYKWHAHQPKSGCWYARSQQLPGHYMHRQILSTEAPHIDHENGDTFDNRRANLRPATVSQNRANHIAVRNSKSGYIGVSPHLSRWRGRLKFDGKVYDLGIYDTPEEAAKARDALAIELHGEFATLNFPGGV